jgi:enamine deaminase RidA (YjgF/YER057c/UK114 family)
MNCDSWRRTEELLQRRGDRLGVDQVVRHQRVGLGLAQALLDGLLDARQARAVLVLGQFAHAAHAAVAQVVDVVDVAVAVAQVDQDLDHVEDVLVGQRHLAFGRVAAHAGVELHAADAAEVVGVLAVEQAVEQRLDGVFGRRLAGAHHAVDGHARRQLVGGLVRRQRLADVGALVQLVRVEALDVLDAGRAQLLQQRLGQLVVGLGHDLAGVGVHHVAGQHAADQEVFGHADEAGAALLELRTCAP